MTTSSHKLRQLAQHLLQAHGQDILSQKGTPQYAVFRVATTFDYQKLQSECLRFIADPMDDSLHPAWWKLKRPVIQVFNKVRLELEFLHCPPPSQGHYGEPRFTELVCHRRLIYTQAFRPDVASDFILKFTPDTPAELLGKVAA